jgi:hypothetical protein
MKVPTRVIGRISRRLEGCLRIYGDSMTPAHRKLLGPVVLAILKASSCYVAEAARELPELGGTITAREDKILNFIHSPKLKLKALKAAHIERLKKDLKRAERVLIYADLSDISKPYARKMDALDIVQDRSDPEKRKRPGYWLNEVYVKTGGSSLVPVVFEPFSTKEEGFRSQNALILDAMEAVYEATGGRGTWISDIGYDDRKYFVRLLDRGRLFIIRLRASEKNSRTLIDEKGKRHRAGTLARHTPLPYCMSAFRGHEDHTGRFGWRKVYLPDRPEPLTLVVFWDRQVQPVMLLTNRRCQSAREALRIIEDYLGRWFGAEDPVRFVKQAFRLEKFLVDDMDAIRAWFFLIMVGFSLLFALSGGQEILRWIMRFAEAFPKEAKFLYYRILRGFRRLLQSLRDPLTTLVSRPRAP